MSTLLGRDPAAHEGQPDGGEDGQLAGGGESSAAEAPDPSRRSCQECGTPLQAGQDWCLECGAAAPGALGPPIWRSTGAVFAVLAALALAAAAAAVAALDQHSPARRTVTSLVAQTPTPAAPPATTTPPPATPAPGAKVPQTAAKLPKIPLTASTPPPTTPPAATTTTPSPASGSSGSSQGSGSGSRGSGEGGEGNQSTPSAIVLDTDAASTYNPYGYPASWFGDPSLAIDGDHSTPWTGQVDPATAPAMAVGVLINVKALKHLGALELFSATKGMVVQVYGSAAAQAPASITDKAWVPLSAPLKLSKANTRFKLRRPKQAFRFATVWISRAPASAVGTPTSPRHVAIGEIELFPPA